MRSEALANLARCGTGRVSFMSRFDNTCFGFFAGNGGILNRVRIRMVFVDQVSQIFLIFLPRIRGPKDRLA